MTKHSRTIALHVRKGDYALRNHPTKYGLLTIQYYIEGVRLIRDQVARTEPNSIDELIAIVFTTQESVSWCVKEFTPQLLKLHLVKSIVCANTSAFAVDKQTKIPIEAERCKGEDVDIFAMSLTDYIILANSTFSWWAHFFQTCRLRILDWWEKNRERHLTKASYFSRWVPTGARLLRQV